MNNKNNLMNILRRSTNLVKEQSSAFIFEEVSPREKKIKDTILKLQNMEIDFGQFIEELPTDPPTTLQELYQISKLLEKGKNNKGE